MRLICPNCGAQYEVDASVIPTAGRDVQCSNCGHTWYQRGEPKPETVAAPATSAEAPATEQSEPETVEVEEPVSEEAPANKVEEDSAEPAVEEDTSEDQDPPAVLEEPEPVPDETVEADTNTDNKRRELSESVTGILQEEAAREVAERESQRSGLETQTEFGLETQQSEEDVMRRMERMRSEDDDVTEAIVATSAGATSARRDLLPDIEEINSTLEASGEDSEADAGAADAQEGKGGFKRGFTTVLVIFVICLVVYVFAGTIVQTVPQAEPVMRAYVDFVNSLVSSIDALLQLGVDRLTALISQFGG